jgi:aquaporin Z
LLKCSGSDVDDIEQFSHHQVLTWRLLVGLSNSRSNVMIRPRPPARREMYISPLRRLSPARLAVTDSSGLAGNIAALRFSGGTSDRIAGAGVVDISGQPYVDLEREAAAMLMLERVATMSDEQTPLGTGEPILAWLGRRAARVQQQAVEFDNPRLEYRRLFSEAWGTFLLVLVAAGGGVIGATAYGSGLTLAMKALAPGIMVMGVIFFMGTISGAHLNPAVTIAFAVRGNFPWLRVPGYIIAQVAGALAASLVLQWMYGGIINGATEPTSHVSTLVAVFTEGILTLGLVSVILGTASGARNIGVNGALAIGGYIGLVSVWAAPVTGASMNPARSFAPMLVGGNLAHYWIYLAGPVGGALVAVAFEWVLRGRATEAGAEAAQGLLAQGDTTGL